MLKDEMIKYRAKERISQEELALRCGLAVKTICYAETGARKPNRLTEEKIRLVIDGQKKEED